jgi:hypothetical protein
MLLYRNDILVEVKFDFRLPSCSNGGGWGYESPLLIALAFVNLFFQIFLVEL